MKPFRHVRLSLLFLTVLLTTGSLFAQSAPDSMERWQNFDFAKTVLKPADLAGVALDDLKLMRGIVFGRHGRVFKDAEIRTYLEAQDWFKANPDFQNSVLNNTENRNLDLIRIAEASKHETVQPGDLRYWQTRTLTAKKLGIHSGAEWRVLRAEIEAIHGKRFTEAWLQQYFDERYWYKPVDNYDPKKLTALEQKNLLAIEEAQKKSRKLALAPGDMELFEGRLISAQMLHGLSLNELRLLRNEIYARHGRQFQAPWLSQYFFGQTWYQPNENFKDEELTGPDKQNVETIVAYENKIHDDLGSKPLTRTLLEGLFVEDAAKMRQEIYARRGKVFTKEPWFQTYFESFAWYKANPEFADTQLTALEKRNIATITAYEKKAVSAQDVIEG
ncbi:MAG TPA: YARHG domain-containing protein [Pyrinomonadaceae bacterium]|nr:YARHG domain-containing protein [Pyrinomonadaceae bacterium]